MARWISAWLARTLSLHSSVKDFWRAPSVKSINSDTFALKTSSGTQNTSPMFTKLLAKGRVYTVLLLPSAVAQRLLWTHVRKVSSTFVASKHRWWASPPKRSMLLGDIGQQGVIKSVSIGSYGWQFADIPAHFPLTSRGLCVPQYSRKIVRKLYEQCSPFRSSLRHEFRLLRSSPKP